MMGQVFQTSSSLVPRKGNLQGKPYGPCDSLLRVVAFLCLKQLLLHRETSMEGLKGKVAIVTGGATMIGAAVVRAFHRDGTKVAIADINEEAGQPVANSLDKDVLFVKTDLADDTQIAACVDRTVAKFGRIDFLVNLACVYIDDALNSTRKDWLDSYNVNVVGGVMMLKAVKPHMVKQGGGEVVNFGSISAKVARNGRWLTLGTQAQTVQVAR